MWWYARGTRYTIVFVDGNEDWGAEEANATAAAPLLAFQC